MSVNHSPHRTDPSLPQRCLGTLAVGIAAALAAGVLMLLQSGCTDEHMALAQSHTSASAQSDTATFPQSLISASPRSVARAASAPSAALDAGVDWGRVEAATEPAGASVAAYDR